MLPVLAQLRDLGAGQIDPAAVQHQFARAGGRTRQGAGAAAGAGVGGGPGEGHVLQCDRSAVGQVQGAEQPHVGPLGGGHIRDGAAPAVIQAGIGEPPARVGVPRPRLHPDGLEGQGGGHAAPGQVPVQGDVLGLHSVLNPGIVVPGVGHGVHFLHQVQVLQVAVIGQVDGMLRALSLGALGKAAVDAARGLVLAGVGGAVGMVIAGGAAVVHRHPQLHVEGAGGQLREALGKAQLVPVPGDAGVEGRIVQAVQRQLGGHLAHALAGAEVAAVEDDRGEVHIVAVGVVGVVGVLEPDLKMGVLGDPHALDLRGEGETQHLPVAGDDGDVADGLALIGVDRLAVIITHIAAGQGDAGLCRLPKAARDKVIVGASTDIVINQLVVLLAVKNGDNAAVLRAELHHPVRASQALVNGPSGEQPVQHLDIFLGFLGGDIAYFALCFACFFLARAFIIFIIVRAGGKDKRASLALALGVQLQPVAAQLDELVLERGIEQLRLAVQLHLPHLPGDIKHRGDGNPGQHRQDADHQQDLRQGKAQPRPLPRALFSDVSTHIPRSGIIPPKEAELCNIL